MKVHGFHRGRSARPDRGFTLLELIIATAILLVLSTMVLPMTRVVVQREREKQLRSDLWEMRDAIDRYKDAADRGRIPDQGRQPELSSGSGNSGKGRRCEWQEGSISAQDSHRSYDGHYGLGLALDAG